MTLNTCWLCQLNDGKCLDCLAKAIRTKQAQELAKIDRWWKYYEI